MTPSTFFNAFRLPQLPRLPRLSRRSRAATGVAAALTAGLAVSPLGSAQAFDGANSPGCHYDNGTLCKGGYHINMKEVDDSLNDAAYLYEVPDGKDTPWDGAIIWSASREHHTGAAKETAEFWTFTKKPGYHYQAVLDVSTGNEWSGHFVLDAEADYCYSTRGNGHFSGAVWVTDYVLIEDAHNSDKEYGDCNLK